MLHRNVRLFCVISTLAIVSSLLTESPQNALSIVGSQTVLKCSTTNIFGGVDWFIYRLNGSSCQFFSSGSMKLGCVNQTRYGMDMDQPAGKYNLMINNTELSDAATYICQDNTNSASAVYGVIDSSVPLLVSNVSANCLLESETVALTCQVTYSGNSLMSPIIRWKTLDGSTVPPGTSISNSSTLYITANKSDIPQYNCTVSFDAPTGDTLPSTINGVTNHPNQSTFAPTYKNTALSQTYTVHYCPATISIKNQNNMEVSESNNQFLPGTVLTCSTSAGSVGTTTTFYWIDNLSGVNTSGSQLNITKVDQFSVTCVANSVTGSCNGRNRTCIISKTVTGTDTPPRPHPCCWKDEYIIIIVVMPVVLGCVIIIMCCCWCPCCPCYDRCSHCICFLCCRCDDCRRRLHKGESDKASTGSRDKITSNARANPVYTPEDQSPGQGQGNLDPPPDVTYAQANRMAPPGASLHYQQQRGHQLIPTNNSQAVSPEGIIYAELSQQAPRSRNPITPASNTIYAPIDHA